MQVCDEAISVYRHTCQEAIAHASLPSAFKMGGQVSSAVSTGGYSGRSAILFITGTCEAYFFLPKPLLGGR